jgi:MYXO-CTERM domain-containing protein
MESGGNEGSGGSASGGLDDTAGLGTSDTGDLDGSGGPITTGFDGSGGSVSGCGCREGREPGSGAWMLLGLLAVLRRRRGH